MLHAELLKKVIAAYTWSRPRHKPATSKDYQIFANLIQKPYVSPKGHADFLGISWDRVNQITRYFCLNSIKRREWALADAEAFVKVVLARLDGNPGSQEAYKKLVTEIFACYVGEDAGLRRGFYLLALIKLCWTKEYQALIADRGAWVRNLSAVDAKNFFRDLQYEIEKGERSFKFDNIKDIITESIADGGAWQQQEETAAGPAAGEAEADRVQALEFQLETTQSTLLFIQRSLDDMVANLNQQAEALQREVITNFFTTINSERFGRLLDNAVVVEQKLSELRKARYRFPVEVLAMPIMIKNLLAFIRAYGFTTIKEPGAVYEAGPEDLLYVEYEGEPFLGEEKKQVQVISPGWQRDEIIISKPVVKEVVAEPVQTE